MLICIVNIIQDTDETLTGLNGLEWSVTLDGIMFDNSLFFPFPATVGFVRAKAYVRPCIFDDVIMHEVFKGGVFQFIGVGRTKYGIVLCESPQDWFEVVVIYKTLMTHANFIKKVQWEGIEQCEIFGGTRLFSPQSGVFQGGWVMLRE